MEGPKQVRLFLSCVSDEFHKADSSGRFLSYRDDLARALRSARVEIIVQEDFAQGFGDLLQTLDDEIARCGVIVHLVGDMAGAHPTADEMRRLRDRHPDLLVREPTLRARINNLLPIAYTQWELYLTYQHQGSPLVFFAMSEAPRSPFYRQEPEQLRSQEHHRQTIHALGKHWDTFVSQDNLCRKVLIALIRHGVTSVGVPARPGDKAVQAAREDMAAIVRDVGQRIERVPHGTTSSSTDVLSRAMETVARSRGINPRDLVRLLDEHAAEQRAEVDQHPTPAKICDLALSQLALGDYELAMRTAAEAAELAEGLQEPGSSDADQCREAALNAYLLLADAAKAGSQLEQAAAALLKGGRLIERDREPLFWADYHERLAETLHDQGHYEHAERYLRAVISIRERHLGEIHVDLAKALCSLGNVLRDRADHPGTEAVARRVLRILEELPPIERNSFIANALDLLGVALEHEGRFEEAEPLLRQVLAIHEGSPDKDDGKIGVALSSLAWLLRETNRPMEAEPLLRRALELCKKRFGPNHRTSAVALNDLGWLLGETNRLSEAIELLQQALAICEHTLGPAHPDFATALSNLAQLLRNSNRLKESEPLFRRALAIYEDTIGPSHQNYALCLNNLALLLNETRRLGEAETLFRRALAIAESRSGPDHPVVAICLNNLGRLLQEVNRLEEAEPLLRRALAIAEDSFDSDHPTVAGHLNSLALLFQATNRLPEAEPLMRRGLEILLKFTAGTGHEHPYLHKAINYYHSLLSKIGYSPKGVHAGLGEICGPYGIDWRVQLDGRE